MAAGYGDVGSGSSISAMRAMELDRQTGCWVITHVRFAEFSVPDRLCTARASYAPGDALTLAAQRVSKHTTPLVPALPPARAGVRQVRVVSPPGAPLCHPVTVTAL